MVGSLLCLFENAHAAEASDRVRLAYLFNFTKFVEWPVESGPFHLCVEEASRFSDISSALSGKQVRGRDIVVTVFPSLDSGAPLDALKHCQVVYVASSTPTKMRVAEPSSATLVVGEGVEFARDVGVIGFVVENDRLRYVVNNTRAKLLHLKISARMLEVAKDVY